MVFFGKRKWKAFILILTFSAMLSGCGIDSSSSGYDKYSYEFTGVFDTVIQFMGYARNQQDFERMAKQGEARFMELHRLFDIYHTYDGINNIKTINDHASIKPVEVSQEIIDLILFSREWYNKTGGSVNIALGPVLSIWHEYRDNGLARPNQASLPPMDELLRAEQYCDMEKIIVNTQEKTVFLSERHMQIDVGAVAKGFATQIVANELKEQGFDSFLIGSGGNVCVVGEPLDGTRTKWGIGIQNPTYLSGDPDKAQLDTVYINQGSVVTSGDYQRYYKVNGRMYHHLIDPKTLMPADHYRSVTVHAMDSGLADFLSSTLFLLPYEESRRLTDQLDGVEALWVFPDGTIEVTEGMKSILKVLGGATNQ